MRKQVLKVCVPLEGLQVSFLAVCVDLLGFEEVGPKFLGLVIFGVFLLKVECLQLNLQLLVGVLIALYHLKIKLKLSSSDQNHMGFWGFGVLGFYFLFFQNLFFVI